MVIWVILENESSLSLFRLRSAILHFHSGSPAISQPFGRGFHALLPSLYKLTFQVLWILYVGIGPGFSSVPWLLPMGHIYFCCPSSTLVTNLAVRYTFPRAIRVTFIPRKGLASRDLCSLNSVPSISYTLCAFRLVEVQESLENLLKTLPLKLPWVAEWDCRFPNAQTQTVLMDCLARSTWRDLIWARASPGLAKLHKLELVLYFVLNC